MSRFKSLLKAGLLVSLLSFIGGGASFAQTANAESSNAPTALRGPEQRVALVIGNSNYQNAPDLANPGNDARSMAQLLNQAGFEVISATDLTQNDMLRVVQDFSAKVAARGQNTVAMVYYAGHGVQLAGENYLVPVDAKVSNQTELVNNSVRLVDVMSTLETIPSRMRIVILDACRNNPFPNVNDAGRGLAIVDAPNGSIVGYSTAPGAEAQDGTGGHSPHTPALLNVRPEPNVPIEQLFKRIRLEVNNSTDGRQTPWESSSLTSDFYFFGDTAVAATRAPAQVKTAYAVDNLPSRAVRQAYDYVLAENSVDNYQEFIRLYPRDPLCDRIRILLASLLQANAWHHAVLENSPIAYKSFYDKYSSSPYAQSALKLAEQPKLVPLSQPTHIITPPSIKLGGGLGISKGNPGFNLGTQGLLQGHGPQQGDGLHGIGKLGTDKFGKGGQIVTLNSPGTTASSGNSSPGLGKLGTDKLGHGGQIVTLNSPGTTTSSGNNGAGSGKIIDLPHTGVNKIGTEQNSKLGGGRTRFDDRSAKSFPQIHGNQQLGGISRSNIATPPKFRQQLGVTNTGSNQHFASTQFHGPAFQSQGRSGGFGGKFGR